MILTPDRLIAWRAPSRRSGRRWAILPRPGLSAESPSLPTPPARRAPRLPTTIARRWRWPKSSAWAYLPARPRAGSAGTGGRSGADTEAYVLLHEIAHFQLAAPARRRLADFGLGPGPESGDRSTAQRQAVLHGVDREREEAKASLLGILWEAELGQPALASFLDQNWLEGAGAPAHFAACWVSSGRAASSPAWAARRHASTWRRIS